MIIGFIGAGKMARALAAGLVRGGVAPSGSLICSTRTEKSGRAFLDLFPHDPPRWTGDNVHLVSESEVVILAIKPQQFPEAIPPLHDASAGRLFLSLAAAVSLEKLRGWLHPTAHIVRAMPNTPMQIGEGASVFANAPNVTNDDRALVHRILASARRAWEVDEKQVDAITALSGSGPAYVFHFLDALIRGAQKLGLPEELARDLAIQTVLGSAQLAAQSSLTPLELAAQVKSPRGTTLAGCAILEENDALNEIMARCLAAARNRAEALARGEL